MAMVAVSFWWWRVAEKRREENRGVVKKEKKKMSSAVSSPVQRRPRCQICSLPCPGLRLPCPDQHSPSSTARVLATRQSWALCLLPAGLNTAAG